MFSSHRYVPTPSCPSVPRIDTIDYTDQAGLISATETRQMSIFRSRAGRLCLRRPISIDPDTYRSYYKYHSAHALAHSLIFRPPPPASRSGDPRSPLLYFPLPPAPKTNPPASVRANPAHLRKTAGLPVLRRIGLMPISCGQFTAEQKCRRLSMPPGISKGSGTAGRQWFPPDWPSHSVAQHVASAVAIAR